MTMIGLTETADEDTVAVVDTMLRLMQQARKDNPRDPMAALTDRLLELRTAARG